MSLALHWQALAGLVLGAACSVGHLALLRGQLERSWNLDSERARSALLRGLPLRVLLWAPAIVGALRLGWAACAGLAVALVAGRWVVLATTIGRQDTVNGVS